MKKKEIKIKLIPDKIYRRITRLVPIACVDLIVTNNKGEILLLRRKNEPAKNEWWFPGGRVHFMETRKDAALRKLKEECGLRGKIEKEIGTYDLVPESGSHQRLHAITTAFQIHANGIHVKIDSQSADYKWLLPDECLKIAKHKFVRTILRKIYDRHDQ